MHVCNCQGKWGGFGRSIDKLSVRPKNAYLGKDEYKLSEVQFIYVNHNLTVANIIARLSTNADSLQYPDLARAFCTINEWCETRPRVSLHAIQFGDWLVTEALIDKIFKDRKIYIYS
jgi:hypothetical protein